MPKQSAEKYVTHQTFIQKMDWIQYEFQSVHQKIDNSEKRLEGKIGNLALSLLKTQDDVNYLKTNMATKQDVNLILDRIDSYVHKNKEIDQEQAVQGLHIKELKEITRHHEKRLKMLESSR